MKLNGVPQDHDLRQYKSFEIIPTRRSDDGADVFATYPAAAQAWTLYGRPGHSFATALHDCATPEEAGEALAFILKSQPEWPND